jgi:hypothetical protein
MWMLPRVELDLAPRVRAEFQIAVALDPLDGGQFAVSEFLFLVRSRELHTVALRELALAVAVDRYTLQAARIVAQLFSAMLLLSPLRLPVPPSRLEWEARFQSIA